MPVLSTVEAQLLLHKLNNVKDHKKHGSAKKLAANNEPDKVRNCTGVTVLGHISEPHYPADS